MDYFAFPWPFGHLVLTIDAGVIIHTRWATGCFDSIPMNALQEKIAEQCQRYQDDPSIPFDLPLAKPKTAFQEKMRAALLAIPSGKTLTYGELARQYDTHPRAVGTACRTNPLLLIIPCHRVVAKNGMGGYSGKVDGAPYEQKKWLLEHEKSPRSRDPLFQRG